MTLKKTISATLAFIAILFVTACSPQSGWHPVNTEESQTLAVSRFNNFDIGTRSFSTAITVGSEEIALNGWIDFVGHAGYAAASGEGFDPQALLWEYDAAALTPAEIGSEGLPSAEASAFAPSVEWDIRGLDPSASSLDALLMIMISLGSDRPENPLLLQQAGALWLGTDEIKAAGKSIPVSVFAAPLQEVALTPDDPQPTPEDALVKLWVDGDGVMWRTEALIAGNWVTIDFGASEIPALTDLIPAIQELTPINRSR